MASASADGPVPATPHVASLTRSFALVPPAGVPAVIDCILASAALSPSELFFALVKAFPELTESLPKEDNANSETDMARAGILISYMAALFHLVKKPDISPDAFKIFIWSGLVPLLSATGADARDLLNQFEDLLCDAVVATQSWELMESTLVPLCLRSMGLSLGMTHPKELAVYHWGDIESRKVCSLPLTVACHLLGSLLDVALRVRCLLGKTAGREVELVVAVGPSEAFARNLTWDLSLTAVDMLLQGLEHRLCAIRLLFPVIFRALVELPSFELLVNGVAHSISRSYFFSNIWERCITMFSLGHLERVDAYCLLSLYFSVFSLRGDVNRADDIYDIRAENKFWVEIRRGLVDKDASVRKHSLYILKKLSCDSFQTGSDDGQNLSFNSEPTVKSHVTASSQDNILSHCGMTRREKWADKEARSMHVGEICRLNVNGLDRWKAFFLLYDMLEEYGTHLVEAAWTHQISLFFQSGSCDTTMNNVTGGFYQNQMASLDGMFCWLAILWERGLVHENPQVRCLIMQSFLGMDWDTHKHYVKCVPKSFIVGSLILGLNDVVHHKDFGVGGVYTSKTIQGAANFFCQYSGELSMSERLEFICSLASLAQEESFGRPGLMAFAFCLSSAACGATTHHESEVQHYENRSPEMQVELHKGHTDYRSSDLLDALGVIIERTKQHFNPNYRLQACEKVLDAASFVVCTCCVPLGLVLHFLSTLPREFIDFGGTLRKKVQQWLHCGSSECLPSSSDVELAFLRNLLDFPTSFMKHRVSTDAFISFDDEDLNAWSFEVQRWLRLLFLLITGEQHLEPIYQVILDFCSSISGCESSLDWFPPKFLILVVCLVDELQILLKKYKYHSGSCSEFEVGVSNILGQLPLTAVLMVFKRFKDTFIFMMDNLMSFANSVCSVFWSAPVGKDTNLPSSVKGKLGGPSQRRLPLLMTTSVLQAILSIKAVASIMSWTMQVEKDLWLGSSFAFLWNFSWKVILLPMNDSEAGAEVHLAAYEALVFVLKALSTAFSPFALEFVRAFNRSTFLNGQDKPPLDPFLLNFLRNINNLLTEGILTRSRRSVLMNWKWLCLDSLLSIPNNAVENGAQPSTADTFFSDSALRITFHDIVESLENAGETSVLPLLRSLRSIIGLFCPGKICLAVSVDNGIGMEMMKQLVHSSWILHLSCNKRRIAPIAALLSSVLHCSIFSDLRMHEMSCGTQGPLKWFIGKILDEGSKSPRTIRLVALHLSGLWLTYPITVKYYVEEIKLLSLYGSVAFDEDFEAELSENLEATLEVRMLSKCPDAELAEVFLNTEMYARVIVAVLFDKLANLADANREQKDNVDAQSALLAGKMFLLALLDSAVTDKDLSKELYKKYSGVHRRKVRAWQMICVLSRFVDQDIVKQVSSIMHVCLYRNNLPAVRQYLEIFAIQIYLRFPSLVEEQLVPIFRDYNVRPQALASYVFIAANVILYASEVPLQLKHLNVLLPPIIPLLTSHHHSLRGFTQLLVYHILCKLMPLLEPNNLEVVPLEKKCFKELKSYLAGNVDCVRLRASMEGFLTSFDPRTAASPAGIFNARNEGSDFECVPMTLMEQVITFLNDVREDLRYSMARDVIAIKNESLAMDSDHKKMEKSLECNGDSLNMYGDTLLDFQKKVTLGELQNWPSYPGVTGFSCQDDFSRSLSEMEDQLFSSSLQSRNAAMGRLRGSRQQFILVASLLDRVPNLAGLARTCEVFGAAGLAIADANIVRDKQFQLISVTADKWVPIIEVPVRSMKAFLEKKKCEGFCILGLEQTANSTPLHQFPFPEKTVLVLGREKEGIPVDIIHCLDACLEIPQLGVIRSLNVHVSGAIALWEYTRQQRLKDL